MKLLITGGAGFIGSAVVREALAKGHQVAVLDAMTYAASPATLRPLSDHPGFEFHQADIRDAAAVRSVFAAARPDAVMHLAAESHVDRSIEEPDAFVQTNVVGTLVMLQQSMDWWRGLTDAAKSAFRFHHISTDEVFGSLGEEGFFTEDTAYDPRSPYSASKAASDHLVRAWGHTYGLPVVLTNCSNNYGPYQFPEKLIPLMILKGLRGEALPVYGDGSNVRDWLHVDDHARALLQVLTNGAVGETYLIGGRAERRNLDVVRALAEILDEIQPEKAPHAKLITFVRDRPGHDQRYAIECSRIETDLGWRAERTFEEGLKDTVLWYHENEAWWSPIVSGQYRLGRLGTT